MAGVVCYLVIGDRIKKIMLQDASLDGLKTHVQSTDSIRTLIGNVNEAVYMIFDVVINDYIDIEIDTIIPNNAKCKVWTNNIPNDVFSMQENVASTSSTQPNVLQVGNIANFRTRTELPTIFILPDFPATVEIKLANKDPVDGKLRRAIINSLYQKLISDGQLYPGRLHGLAAASLVAKYPHLRDVVGDAYESWNQALRTKFKNERRNMQGDVINEMREKYRTKRKATEAPVVINVNRKENPNLLEEMEDEESIQAHHLFLENESKKIRPSELVEDRMMRTYLSRRKFVQQNTITAVIEKYKFLQDKDELIREFQRRTNKDINCEWEINIPTYAEKIIRIATNAQASIITSNYDNARGQAATLDCDLYPVYICALSSTLFKEDLANAVGKKKRNVPTPYGLIEEDSMFMSTKITVYINYEPYVTVDNILTALKVIFASYWAFDLKYTPKLSKTLAFFEFLFCGVVETPLPPTVANIVSTLKNTTM